MHEIICIYVQRNTFFSLSNIQALKIFFKFSRIFILSTILFCTLQSKAQVKAKFSSDVTSGCSPLLVNFKNESTGINDNTEYYWDLGNGGSPSQEKEPSAIFLNNGSGSATYTVTLVIKGSTGTDSITKTNYITVYASPKVAFSADATQGCPPLNVNFTDGTKAGSGTIKTWLWDFGEGQLSNQQNPSTTYHSSNTYRVSLSVVNTYGCKQTAQSENTIHVLDTVKANFAYQYTNLCQSPAPVSFQSTSQSGTTVTSNKWDFGDGQTGSDTLIEHTYMNTGNYTVKLISKNAAGCFDSSIQKISIGKVGANFSYKNTCANSAVQFTDSSSSKPTTSNWNFGDGTTSKETSPKHTYTVPGTYTVTLQADFGTCTGTVTKKITITNKPATSFTVSPSGTCQLPFPVTFTNLTTGADAYQWLFGDAKTAVTKDAVHTYTNGGFYDVSLIASTLSGCSDTSIIKNAVKLGPPKIDSIQNLRISGCVPQVINPVASIRTAEPVVKYFWNFGDSTFSTDEKPQHIYTKAGSYTVSLIAMTAGGCSDTFAISKPVLVGTVPVAKFGATPLDVCARINVNFTDSSKGTVTSWLWKFGDGGQSTQSNPSHHYMDTGYFDVQLIVSNNNCKDTLTKQKYVYIRPPVANYQTSLNCSKPFERVFTDKSVDAKTWTWDFGDGSTSKDKSPVHTFDKTGTYMIKLTVANEQCFDSMLVKLQVVDEHPSFTHNYETKGACRNDVVTFTATNIITSNINSYNWIFGDKTSTGLIGNAATATHKYLASGSYLPQLITKDIVGCMDTVIGKVNATIYGPVATFATDSGACINSFVTFKDSSKTDSVHSIQSWKWTYEPNVTQTYTAGASVYAPIPERRIL